MSRSSSERAAARRHGRAGATRAGAIASGALALGIIGIADAFGPRTLGAQPPRGRRAGAQEVPPAPDSAARADTARADSVRRATVSDSTQRDSLIAGQLRSVRRRGDPVAGPLLALDRLRLSAVGVSGGMAMPDQVRGTTLYAVDADYGEIARELHAVFGLMFWSSAFRAAAVDRYARTIAAVATPDGQPPPTVTLGRVRASDVVLHGDLRWRPRVVGRFRAPGVLRPWVSGGGAVHLLDVQGRAVSGTFVERALDGIALGVAAAGGADLQVRSNVQVTGLLRYDLFPGAHFASARAGLSYVFDRSRR